MASSKTTVTMDEGSISRQRRPKRYAKRRPLSNAIILELQKAQGPTSERWGSPRASSGELVLATSSCCLRLQYYLLHCYYSSNSKSSLLALVESEESDLGLYLSTIHKGHQLPSKSWYKLKPALSARNLV